MNYRDLKYLFVFIFLFTFFPVLIWAVPPPDFIINVASQLSHLFAVGFVFLMAIFSTSYQFLKTHLAKHKKLYWAVGVILIIGVSFLGAHYLNKAYEAEMQQLAYQQWLEESKLNDTNPADDSADSLLIEDDVVIAEKGDTATLILQDTDNLSVVSDIKIDTDPGIIFIKNYYENIAAHNFELAYAMSSKVVPLATFASWYELTTAIEITNIIKIDDDKYSLELTLYDGDVVTYYAVLTTLNKVDGIYTNIKESKVRVLTNKSELASSATEGIPNEIKPSMPSKNDLTVTYNSFWEKNQQTDLILSNNEFAENFNNSDYIVLDARENIEFEMGHIDGATHIRFADLQAGRWVELPTDKFIYVICWSGIRGKEVAEYLRTKGLVSRYLEEGGSGWVDFGGPWQGDIKFLSVYQEERYRLVYSTDEFKNLRAQGVQIVDCRSPQKFAKSHIPNSVNIPLMYTPSSSLVSVFAQLPANSKVITLCDDYVNCFDAKLTGVELERRGHEFLGRYNKPWEY